MPSSAASPAMRSTKATPTAAELRPRASRAFSVSWAATAARPPKAIPDRPTARPSASAPVPPWPARLPAMSRVTAPLAMPTASSAEVRPARRPTMPHGERLLTAGLLLLTGVPDHDQQAHDRGEHRKEGTHAPDGERAERVVEGGAEQGPGRAVPVHVLDEVGAPGGGVVRALQTADGAAGREPQAQHPHRHHDPVAPQREPQQRARAYQIAGRSAGAGRDPGVGYGGHRTIASASVCEMSSW